MFCVCSSSSRTDRAGCLCQDQRRGSLAHGTELFPFSVTNQFGALEPPGVWKPGAWGTATAPAAQSRVSVHVSTWARGGMSEPRLFPVDGLERKTARKEQPGRFATERTALSAAAPGERVVTCSLAPGAGSGGGGMTSVWGKTCLVRDVGTV